MRKLFIVLICAVFFPTSLFGKAADIDLPRLIKICESYQNAVKDVNIEYSVEYKNAYTDNDRIRGIRLISEEAHFVAIKPFSIFYNIEQSVTTRDRLGNRRQILRHQAWDGDSFLPSDPNLHCKYYRYNTTPLGFSIFYPLDEHTTLLSRFKHSAYKCILDPNVRKVNDFNAIEVAVYSVFRDQSFLCSKLYFSVDHNYAVVCIIEQCLIYEIEPSNSMFEPLVFNVLQLKEFGKGIWFPTKTSYERSENYQKIMTVKNMSINQGLTSKYLTKEHRGENNGNLEVLSVKASDMTLNQLIKICESYQNAVKDVNIEYSVEYKNAYTNERKRDIKLINEKVHFIGIKPFSFFYNIEQLTTTEDLLGRRKETLHYEALDGDSFLSSHSHGPVQFYLYNMTPLGFTPFYQQNPYITLPDIFKDTSHKNILDTNIRKVNDFNVIEVASYYVFEKETVLDARFYFSINHNYALVCIQESINPDTGITSIYYNVTKLKYLGKGIWFPVQVTYEYTEDYLKAHNKRNQYQLPFYHPLQLQKIGNDVKSLFTGPIEHRQSMTVNKVSINQGLTSKNLINRSVSENGTIP